MISDYIDSIIRIKGQTKRRYHGIDYFKGSTVTQPSLYISRDLLFSDHYPLLIAYTTIARLLDCSMGKTPLSVNKNSINNQSKIKSDSPIVRTSSSGSIQRTRKSHGKSTRRVPLVTTSEKENIGNQTKSTSDVSDDEQMECETIPQQVPRKRSAVHEFATKLSPQDYQCKLCSKVNITPILSQTISQDD